MNIVEVRVVCLITVLCAFPGLFNCSVCPEEPLCDCRPNTGMFDIYCTNLTNLETVVKLLHDLFLNSTINKLMFVKNCRLTLLPNHAFENITILIFLSSCPFTDIPEDVFRGSSSLTKIELRNTTFSAIPSGLLNLEQLKTLNLKYNRLTALNHELWNLTSLLFLSISDGGLKELPADVFIRTPQLQYLDLSYNRLRYLNPETLKPLTSLQRINLRGNQIITADGLFKYINPEAMQDSLQSLRFPYHTLGVKVSRKPPVKSHLQMINLFDNNLTSLDNVFHRGMWRLKSLNIGKNPITYLNSSSIKSMFLNLEIFDLSSMKCSQIDPDFFHTVPKLKEALLRRNKLQNLPTTLFHNLRSLRTVDLTRNNITSIEGIFRNSPEMRLLLLGGNKISKLENSFQNLRKLEKLYLDSNEIKRINKNDFDGLVNLKYMKLSQNKMDTIESGSLSGLQSLLTLELSANRFMQLNRSLQNLFSLKELSLRSVNLQQVNHDDFLGLTKLSVLNLVDNKIKSLNGAFRDVRSLETLTIAKNKLVTLSRSTFPEQIKLQALWLASGNKLRCDCRLSWMIKWLAEKNYTVLKDNPLCYLPFRLKGKPIKALTLNDVTIWPENCPAPCQCKCVDQDSKFYVQVNCSNRSLTNMPNILPQETGDLDLSGNELESVILSDPNFTYGLINLNLENNKLTDLSTDTLKYVKELKLAGNLLNRLPWSVHLNDTLQLLTLANNPWICDCNAADFRKWLISKGDIVADINETRCGHVGPYPKLHDRVIISLRDTDLCPSVISLYIFLAIGLLGVLLLAASMVLAYSRYHLYIKVWLYAHGNTWVKEDDMDTDKLFDALVSYHQNDEDFIFTEISPKLEQEEPTFTLCIPQRDFVCGEFEANMRMKAVEDSKRVIVILTEDYMNDALCMSIFQQAFEQSLEDKVPRIILIKMADITKSEDMNSELKATLKSTNCIPWGHRLFWERLRYAMPKKRTARSYVHNAADVIIPGNSTANTFLA